MNPKGRPKIDATKRRDADSILVRFNASEAKKVERAVKASGLLPAKWARERLLEVAE